MHKLANELLARLEPRFAPTASPLLGKRTRVRSEWRRDGSRECGNGQRDGERARTSVEAASSREGAQHQREAEDCGNRPGRCLLGSKLQHGGLLGERNRILLSVECLVGAALLFGGRVLDARGLRFLDGPLHGSNVYLGRSRMAKSTHLIWRALWAGFGQSGHLQLLVRQDVDALVHSVPGAFRLVHQLAVHRRLAPNTHEVDHGRLVKGPAVVITFRVGECPRVHELVRWRRRPWW